MDIGVDTVKNDGNASREEPNADQASPAPRTYVNRLTPPPDFSYWGRREFKIFSNSRITDPASSSYYVTVDWQCVAHIYTTGAKPDQSNFASAGGVVYIVLTHQGTLNSVLVPKSQNVTLITKPSYATPDHQLPTHSTESGNYWNTKIDYRQRFQMFKSGGNSLEAFEGEYVNEYQLEKMQQTGQTFSDRLEMFFVPNPSSAWQSSRGFSGLSVLRNSDPKKFPLRFTFEAVATFTGRAARITQSVNIPLGF
ncbi:hypothetical protein ONZ45_g19538 [Pleurotus djamor]|nr:hypothetical protein ONZ45_g19538 [Pleurotus djamor]